MARGHGEKMSRKGDLLVAALLTEPTLEAAAARAGVAVNTAKNWLKDPAFLAAYREARRRVVEQAGQAMQRPRTSRRLGRSRFLASTRRSCGSRAGRAHPPSWSRRSRCGRTRW